MSIAFGIILIKLIPKQQTTPTLPVYTPNDLFLNARQIELDMLPMVSRGIELSSMSATVYPDIQQSIHRRTDNVYDSLIYASIV